MPTPYSNFTHPDREDLTNNRGAPPQAPPGQGQGEEWRPDGNTQNGKWVPTGVPQGAPGPQGTPAASGVTHDPVNNITSYDPGATTGTLYDPGSWGGIAGEVVVGADGRPVLDTTRSGRARDVEHYRGLANSAYDRKAYQPDFAKGNADRLLGIQSRGQQSLATSMLQNAAMGGAPSRADILSQGAIDNSLAAQMGAAAGARGGPGAQSAARLAGARAASANQVGVAGTLGAERSGELAQDRGAFAKSAGAMRSGDYLAQALEHERNKTRYASEIGQRRLNQAGRQAYEDMALDVNREDMNMGLRDREAKLGILENSLKREGRTAQRAADVFSAGASAGADLGKGAMKYGEAADREEEERRRKAGG